LGRGKTLAVIGPNASKVDLGGYSNVPAHAVSLLEGIKAKVGNRARILTAEGVRITERGDWYSDQVVLANPQENRARIQQAVNVARDADQIVLAPIGVICSNPVSRSTRSVSDCPIRPSKSASPICQPAGSGRIKA
jgi:hypothetical protein